MKNYKLVKCYYEDGSFSVMFDFGGEDIYMSNDKEGVYARDFFQKIEPLEQNDTLQEVVEWCCNNNHCVEVTPFGFNFHGDVPGGKQHVLIKNTTELLNHIRKPKLKEITPEELAEKLPSS